MWIKFDKKLFTICFLTALLGSIWGFNLNTDNPVDDKIHFLYNDSPDYYKVFFHILFRNLTVGFMLSLVGFFTGGFLTLLLFLYNGFMFGLTIKTFYNNCLYPSEVILKHVMPHAFTEILGFCLLGTLGLRGFMFYTALLCHSKIDLGLIPKVEEAMLPAILIFISAIIETFIST